MGGAVSSGESNDDLIDNLLEADYIKSPMVERVFRAVDRAFYYTKPYRQNAYKDLAWKDGNLHLSAPCIYSEVMENLQLERGFSFLNIGSGTGYLSTMSGLLLGRHGINHGIELYPEVVDYARDKLNQFLRVSSAVDLFDFCPPQFVVGNCMDSVSPQKRYDRIYCGAACPEESIQIIIDLLKIGGMCVVPVNDSLVQMTRLSESRVEMKQLLPVSFATLIASKALGKLPIQLPEWNPPKLVDICRAEIRAILRKSITPPEVRIPEEQGRKKRRRRRQERRRASRLLVVQRRRSGGEPDGENNGFVAIAYSMGNHSSDGEDTVDSDSPLTGDGAVETDCLPDLVNAVESHNEDDQMMDHLEEAQMPTLEPMNGVADSTISKEMESNSSNPVETVSFNGCNGTSRVKIIGDSYSSGVAENGAGSSSNAGATSEESLSDTLPKIRTNLGSNQNPTSESIFDHIRDYVHSRRSERSHRQIHEDLGRHAARCARYADLGAEEDARRHAARSSRHAEREAEEAVEVPAEAAAEAEAEQSVEMDMYDINEVSSSIEDSSASSTSSSGCEADIDSEFPIRKSFASGVSNATSTHDENPGNLCTPKSTEDKVKQEADADCEENSDETEAAHPFSVEMREKIERLPLPPALKVYLNYNRRL